jgi:hypothetical protein
VHCWEVSKLCYFCDTMGKLCEENLTVFPGAVRSLGEPGGLGQGRGTLVMLDRFQPPSVS